MIELRTLGTLDLRTSDGSDLRPLLKGPKRVALLAYLAIAAPTGFHRRDTLLAMFWPECSDQQARSSLRNTLHVLRRFLGPNVLVNRGDDEVGIAEGALRCDAVSFRDACTNAHLERAIDLYRGELLPGFFVTGAAGFEEWLSRERDALHRAAFEAAWALAEAEEQAGNATAAALHARHAAGLCSLDEEAVRRLIQLLDRLGDRAGALATYEQFGERLQAELDGEPAPETQALVKEVRRRHRAHTTHPRADARFDASVAPLTPDETRASPVPDGFVPDEPQSADALYDSHSTTPPSFAFRVSTPSVARTAGAPPNSPPTLPPPSPQSWRRNRRSVVIAGMALLLIGFIGVGAWMRLGTQVADARLILAVGEVQAFDGAEDAGVTRVLPGMLSTSLAQAEGLRVITTSRVYDVRNRLGEGASLAMAAREAGADELLEGLLVRTGDGLLRLDLRRVDLVTGEVRAVYQAQGPDPFVLVDRVTAELLNAFGVSTPRTGIAAVSTSSLLAYGFFQEGVRAYYQGDNRSAQRLLTAALAEDPNFAMAAYYRAQSHRRIDHAAFRNDLHRAARLAGNASDRERLLIRSAWAQVMDEPAQLALAESLVVRFPAEPEGHLFLGKARLWSGDFVNAMPHLRRVVEMDSLSLRGETPRCLACAAIEDIIAGYMLADSLPAAEREARRWVALQPASARSWHALASSLEYQGRLTEAQVARSDAALLRSDNPRDPLYPVVLALRAGNFDQADRLLAERDRPGESLVQQNVLWYRVLSLRYQGRPSEALEVARQYGGMIRDAASSGHSPLWAEVLEAQVEFELGNARRSAALWREMAAAEYEPDSPSRSARHQAWTLTHAAAAVAATNDAGRLAALADSIETLGRQSAYGRDPRLHHHVRGLLHGVQGDTAAAVAAYQRAMFSTTSGYGRNNLELGRGLLALDRPREAADVLTAALHGPLDAANLYVSRTEIHEMAGHAWEAAGRPDLAIVHYRWAAEAWKRADPSFTARLENLQRRLARLAL